MIGIECDENSAEIGDAFVYGQATVHMHAPKGLEGTVLSSQLGGANVELAGVGVSPPIRERAFRVVFASIIIKGMGQLMTDNSANAPVVDRAISRWIEIWSLQLPSWQHHLIEVRAVIAVYGLRGRTPFIAIDQ